MHHNARARAAVAGLASASARAGLSSLARAVAGPALARAASEALKPLARAGDSLSQLDIHSSKLILSLIFHRRAPRFTL